MFSHRDVADVMVKNMYHILSLYFDKTYKVKPVNYDLTIDEVSDYQKYVNNYEAFKNETLKDGIYLDYNSFFRQIPEDGNYILERFEDGKLARAVKTENGKKKKIPTHKMFIYVENGKAFKNTFSGFYEVNRNEKGFYIFSKPEMLYPPQYNIRLGMMFGLVGVIADAIISSSNQKGKDVVQEIYIDPMTGEFDFQL